MDRLLLFYGVPTGLFCLMVISLWLGLRWDKARGRWRCPRCWYDRHDVVEEGMELGACPECGHKPKRRADLQRTRRSRPLVLLGLAQMPVIVWWIGALGGGRGLLWPVPAFALVKIQVLSTSAARGSWFDQLVRTEVGTRRNTGRWSGARDAELAQSIPRTPMVRELKVPKRWPENSPVPVIIDGERMIGPYAPTRVEIEVESAGERFGPFGFRDIEMRRVLTNAGEARPMWVLFVTPRATGEVVVDVRARWRADRGSAEQYLPEVVEESVTFQVEEAPDFQSLFPAAPESVTEVLRKGWTVGTLRGGISVKYPEDESLKAVSLGMSVELWCGSERVATGEMWLPVFPREPMTSGQFCSLEGTGVSLTAEQLDKGPWMWRVRSNPVWGAVGGLFECTSVWAGEFEVRASKPSARWLQSIAPRDSRDADGRTAR